MNFNTFRRMITLEFGEAAIAVGNLNLLGREESYSCMPKYQLLKPSSFFNQFVTYKHIYTETSVL